MANKFQVGQTVRHVKRYDGKDSTRYTDQHLGETFVITDVNTGRTDSPDPYWYQNRETGDSAWESNLELIEPHTPYTVITPKVGEKYRMLKNFRCSVDWPTGFITTIQKIEGTNIYHDDASGNPNRYSRLDQFTTYYFELVSPAPEENGFKKWTEENPLLSKGTITTTDGTGIYIDAGTGIMTKEPINQSIIQKAMTLLRKLNNWQKTHFNKDIAVQYEVGFINEDLTPTGKAKEELTNILLAEYNDKLTARAEEIKKEMLEAEKDK